MTLYESVILLAAGAAVGGIGVYVFNRLLRTARASMQTSFQALSAQALRENNTQFLENARRVLEDALRQSRADLEQRRESVENLVKPVQDALGTLHGEIRKIEGRREEAFTTLQSEIVRLQRETGNLTTALRRPQGRGKWGELTLQRVVESAGMSAHCDFTEQSSQEDAEGRRFRPDMLVHLPGGREIVVDSKTPLDAYLDAVDAQSDAERSAALVRHASQVRKQMEHLSGKEYWSRLGGSPEFVVLFLPGESFFSAALEQDRDLIEDGIARRVILSTPTTLIALLKAVSYGWRQQQVEENARRIGDLGKLVYERVANLTEHLREVGTSLDRAVGSYNKAVGSYNTRVLVATRRFKELDATPAAEIAPVEEIERSARTAELGQQTLDFKEGE